MARILVVDDEENIGRSLRLILEREGHDVALARSVAEAGAEVEEPDLELLDVRVADGVGDAPAIGCQRDFVQPAKLYQVFGNQATSTVRT